MLKLSDWKWVTDIAIDTDGSIWAYEGDCVYADGGWIPIDKFDGLRFKQLGDMPGSIPNRIASTLHFKLVEQNPSTGNPYDFPASPRFPVK